MHTLRLHYSAVLLVLGVFAAGCSTGPITTPGDPMDDLSGDPVVATFAGESLTLDEFEARYALASGSVEAAAADSLAAYQDFLGRYVDFRLKVRQAQDLGIAEDPEIQKEIDEYRRQLAKPYLLERTVLEDLVRDLYEKQKEEVRASHILIRVDENAVPADTLAAYNELAMIRDSVLAGADFAMMAKRHSDDPSAERNDGDLKYFTGGRMIQSFEDMAYGTDVGAVSPVFRTRFGYHILKVTDRRDAVPEIRASHILIRVEPESSAADSTEALELAQSLQQRIEAGEDFAVLAAQYSDDPPTRVEGGDLGFFSQSRMVPEFGEAAYALENIGDVSDVVETVFGYHLIKLTDRKTPRSYEESYEELKSTVERLPRTNARRQAVGRDFRAEVGSELDTELILRATADYPADTLLRKAVLGRFDGYADSTFAAIGDSTFTLGVLADFVRTLRVTFAPDQQAQLFDFTEQFLNEQAFELAALRLEETDTEFRRIMQDYKDGVLLFRISEDSVWTAATRDSLGLRAFFDANAADYQYPERRRAIGFYSRNDSLLQVVVDGLDAGQTAFELEATLADADPGVRIDTVYVEDDANAPFAEALSLDIGEHTSVLPYQSRKVVLYLDGIEAARGMTFDEARALATTDYQDELDARLRTRLRAKYDAELYPERLRLAFQNLAGGSASAGAAQ